MHVLLVEPEYYTRFPPLGLLKLATYHKAKGDTVEFLRGCKPVRKRPRRVYITSLFTWAWKPVWETVKYYKHQLPKAKIWLGGLYASLMPEHAARSRADHIHKGLFKEAENMLPDYSLVPDWDGSIVFSSRGCNRKCPFCAVPILEGKLNSIKYSISHLIYPSHSRVIFWDNNILQSPGWKNIFSELEKLGLKVDFNQGLDARLITDDVAQRLARLRLNARGGIKIRLGYDLRANGPFVERAIERLNAAGIRGRDIIVYTLFNYNDSPQDFFERLRDLTNWGAVCYPMRYEPLKGRFALKKNTYVASNWTCEEIEMVQRARRVMGAMGTFPPRPALLKKFNKARNFHEAFKLRPLKREKFHFLGIFGRKKSI